MLVKVLAIGNIIFLCNDNREIFILSDKEALGRYRRGKTRKKEK